MMSDRLAGAVLDALPDATAVLDSSGSIVAVNRTWRMFAVDNGGRPGATGVGVNYLDVCARSAAVTAPRIIAGGLAALAERISGALAEPHLIHGHSVRVPASVGTHLAAPGDPAADALRHADQAMYALKRARPPQVAPGSRGPVQRLTARDT